MAARRKPLRHNEFARQLARLKRTRSDMLCLDQTVNVGRGNDRVRLDLDFRNVHSLQIHLSGKNQKVSLLGLISERLP